LEFQGAQNGFRRPSVTMTAVWSHFKKGFACIANGSRGSSMPLQAASITAAGVGHDLYNSE
jgi:hypothetical protein